MPSFAPGKRKAESRPNLATRANASTPTRTNKSLPTFRYDTDTPASRGRRRDRSELGLRAAPPRARNCEGRTDGFLRVLGGMWGFVSCSGKESCHHVQAVGRGLQGCYG